MLSKVEEAEKFKKQHSAAYQQLGKRYAILSQIGAQLAEASGVKYVQPPEYESWHILNPEAAALLLRLIEALYYFQDVYGCWDDLIKWNIWGYLIDYARRDWHSAARSAQRVAWIWYRRDHIADTRVWTEKMEQVIKAAHRIGPDQVLAADLELTQGRLELLDGHIDQASDHFKQALSLYQSAKDFSGIWLAHYDLGLLETRRRNHTSAQYHLDEARPLADQQGWAGRQLECQYGYWRLNEDWTFEEPSHAVAADQAFSALLESQTNGTVQSAQLTSRIYLGLALAQKKQGNLQDAYFAARKAMTAEKAVANDSLD